MKPTRAPQYAALGLLLLAPAACRKQEQEVVGVAQTAVKAEHKAQASASERDQLRGQLARIVLPTKSMYVDIRDTSGWANPLLIVGPDAVALRVGAPEPRPVTVHHGEGKGGGARTAAEAIAPTALGASLVAIPAAQWPYGRVVAVAEQPNANGRERVKVRRNMEVTLKQLNDLGVVVEEFPQR